VSKLKLGEDRELQPA